MNAGAHVSGCTHGGPCHVLGPESALRSLSRECLYCRAISMSWNVYFNVRYLVYIVEYYDSKTSEKKYICLWTTEAHFAIIFVARWLSTEDTCPHISWLKYDLWTYHNRLLHNILWPTHVLCCGIPSLNLQMYNILRLHSVIIMFYLYYVCVNKIW